MEMLTEKLFDFPKLQYNEKDYFSAHENLLKFLAAEIKPQDKKILDIGCATGLVFLLVPGYQDHQIYGVDIEQDFIDVFKKRFDSNNESHASVCNIERESLPFNDNEFDLVICNSVLEHTLTPKHLISEIHRILKPGGRVIFAVPHALALIKRWNLLRGRNVFTPLIDNLINRTYQKRCAVLYSVKDIKMATGSLFKDIEIRFFEDTAELKNTNPGFLKKVFINFVCSFFPEWRDTLVAVARK